MCAMANTTLTRKKRTRPDRLQAFTRNAVTVLDGEATRAANFDEGTVPAVISSGEVARDRARIEQDGWDFTNFRQNPVVLHNHDAGDGGIFGTPSGRLPIARSEDEHLERDRDRTVATARFDMDDAYATRVLRKISGGYINATSVRWLPLATRLDEVKTDDGTRVVLVFERCELLEWSFVTIPADPRAVILRADGEPLDPDDFADDDPTDDEDESDPDERPSLIDTLDSAHALLESVPDSSVFTEEEAEAATRLYALLTGRVDGRSVRLPTSARDEIADVLDGLTASVARMGEAYQAHLQTCRTPDELVAEQLARVTGRSTETVLTELRSSYR